MPACASGPPQPKSCRWWGEVKPVPPQVEVVEGPAWQLEAVLAVVPYRSSKRVEVHAVYPFRSLTFRERRWTLQVADAQTLRIRESARPKRTFPSPTAYHRAFPTNWAVWRNGNGVLPLTAIARFSLLLLLLSSLAHCSGQKRRCRH